MNSERRPRPSFENVNYVLRPRKQIERKVIIEILQRLQSQLGIAVSDYRYVGLGSIHYYDFILFNKLLNITDMVSIDCENCPKRFEFNKPFDFVTFHNTTTTDFLLSRSPDPKKTIMWMDYDAKLIAWSQSSQNRGFHRNPMVFDDVRIVAGTAVEHDFFVVTVNVAIPKGLFDIAPNRQLFLKAFGDHLSREYRNKEAITFDNYPRVIQDILLNAFKNSAPFRDVKFRKLFSFVYQDGALMYTLGGIFTSEPLSDAVADGVFIVTDEARVVRIEVPVLTYKEKSRLDQTIDFFTKGLPCLGGCCKLDEIVADHLGFELERSELENYLRYYRYYPQYYEGIV